MAMLKPLALNFAPPHGAIKLPRFEGPEDDPGLSILMAKGKNCNLDVLGADQRTHSKLVI